MHICQSYNLFSYITWQRIASLSFQTLLFRVDDVSTAIFWGKKKLNFLHILEIEITIENFLSVELQFLISRMKIN